MLKKQQLEQLFLEYQSSLSLGGGGLGHGWIWGYLGKPSRNQSSWWTWPSWMSRMKLAWPDTLAHTLLTRLLRQGRARYSRFSRSSTFWCSRFPLGYQDLDYECLVSFPFSRSLFLKSWSCLVSRNSFGNLDNIDQILVIICNFWIQRIFSIQRKISWNYKHFYDI